MRKVLALGAATVATVIALAAPASAGKSLPTCEEQYKGKSTAVNCEY
jgi:hypothetical protein